MKIVQMVTQMEAGGAQRVAILLNEALQKRGYDVELWFLYLKRPTYVNYPGVKVLLEHKPSAVDYFKIATKLWSWLRTQKPDVVITHTHYANVLGQSLARLSNIPTRIAVQHNPLSTYPKLANWADSVLGATNFYSVNVAVSQAVVESAGNYLTPYKQKLLKIYNGVPSTESKTSPSEIKAKWGLPNAPLLLNVARLAPQKNQAILLKALLQLPEAHLLLVGEGELRSTLQQQVAQLQLAARVHFLGELEPEDVLELLTVADVFVFPSYYEAMPMALVEAMASGVPVVGSDIPAMHEVLGDAGIIVPADSAEEIATAIRKIFDSAELRNQLQMRSRERASVFSLQKMVDAYESLLA